MIKAYYRCLLLLKQKNLRLAQVFFIFNMTALA